MSGIADVATKVWGDLKDGRRSEPVATAEPAWVEVSRAPHAPRRRQAPRPRPGPAPGPDANARQLLALRYYLDRGLQLDEAAAATNRYFRLSRLAGGPAWYHDFD